MPLVVADRVRETSNTTGTGTLTLAGAVTGFRTFSSGIGNGNTTYYSISNPNNNQWEVGLGTVGAGTLARTTVLASSNANALVNFTAGPLDVFCTYPAGKSVNLDEVNGLELNSTWNQGTGILQVTGSTSTSGNTVSRNVVLAGGNNLLTFSEQFDNAAWGKPSVTVTANATVAPNGTTTADKLIVNSGQSGVSVQQNVTKAASAIQYTASAYVKQSEWNSVGLYVTAGGFANRATAVFNLATGVISTAAATAGTFTGASATITLVGDGWYRITLTFTTGPETVIGVQLYPAQNGAFPVGDGTSGIFAWGMQVELGNTASPYTATTSAPVSTVNDVFLPSGALRNGTWNQGTGALQITGNATVDGNAINRNVVLAGGNNLILQSETFDNASWTKTRSSITANNTTAPDGAATADRLVEDTQTGAHFLLQQVTTVVSTTYTFSVFLRQSGRTRAAVEITNSIGTTSFRVNANLTNGTFTTTVGGSPTSTASTMVDVGNGWYRVSVAMSAPTTATQGIVYIQNDAGAVSYTGDGTSGIFVWGAQFETGTVASAYTPTTTTAVSATNQVLAGNGTSSAPAYSFAASPGMGLWSQTPTQMIFTAGGQNVFGINSLNGTQLSSTASYGWGSTTALGAATDLSLFRDAANTLGQRNGAAAQTYNLYNTFTDTSNYERFAITWSGNQLQMNAQAAGTGVQRNIGIQTAGGTVSIGGTTTRDRLTVINGSISLDNTRGINILDNAGTGESVINVTSANNLSIASPTLSGSIQYTVRNASGIHQFFTGGSERMRITSTGLVGIGTSSPATRLQVNNAATVGLGPSGMSGISPILYVDNGSTTNGSIVLKTHGTTTGNVIGALRFVASPDGVNYNWGGIEALSGFGSEVNTLAFYTSSSNTGGATSTERMRIDNAGNMGLAIVPSPWGASNKAYQFPAGAVWAFSNTQMTIGQNVYDSGSGTFIYVNTAAASRYRQLDGAHAWFSAPSGTAGATISFTQAMTLTSSGNLGIGTSSPTSLGGHSNMLTIFGSNATGITLGNSTGSGVHITKSAADLNIRNTEAGYIRFTTSDTERLRITSTGNVGIGTSSPTSGYLLDVAGGIKLSGAFDEGIFAVTGTTPALSPSNGTIQTWTLSGNSTPTAGTWADGESMTMMILDGTAFTITWTSVAVTWVGGSAPTLDTTKQNVIELWRVGGVIYGALVGAA